MSQFATLVANITDVIITDCANDTWVEFSLHDENANDEIAFMSKINLSHACYLYEHTSLSSSPDAYTAMLYAIVNANDLNALVDTVYESSN